MKNYLLFIGALLFIAVAVQAQEKKEEMRPSLSPMKQTTKSSSAIMVKEKASGSQQHGQRSVKPIKSVDPTVSGGANPLGWGENKTPRASGLPTGKPARPVTTGRPNYNAAILSKASLSNWNQVRTESVRLVNQLKVSPKKRKVISNVTRTLNEINGIMQKIAELEKNPLKNKSALINASFELRKYEKQIKGLKQEVKLLYQEEGTSGDDSQLANIELQNMLQKQQQTIQMLSNVEKMMNDTAMAVIRKIG